MLQVLPDFSYSSADILLNIIKILFLQKFDAFLVLLVYSLVIRLMCLNAGFSVIRELFVR